MARAERLLDLIQILRRHRRPVSGHALAAELGVSLRTLYRDVAALQARGAVIDGEPGVGYILRQGFLLPPLMFSEEEIEALVLGSRWVADRADDRLGRAARDALAKIVAVLPPDMTDSFDASALLVGPGEPVASARPELATIRDAIRAERKLILDYRDEAGTGSQRTVWPFAVGFFDRVHLLVAWCELRQAYRNFRLDRIALLTPTETRYPRRRLALLKEWREHAGVPRQ
jgi:predicted DNA-binding transcriptional regulator YafY